MKKILAVVLLSLAVFVVNAQGLSPKQAFLQLKKLAGTWEMKGPGGESLKVIYKVSGAGNTLIETQMPDTSMEMVSVYHMDGKNLMMTHYCAVGNQPSMVYKPGKDPKVLFFDFVHGTNMKPTDMHIHSAKICELAFPVSGQGVWFPSPTSGVRHVKRTVYEKTTRAQHVIRDGHFLFTGRCGARATKQLKNFREECAHELKRIGF